jgi:hypothetical protein
MAKKELDQLQEKVSVGGGATGKSETADPVGGTATLPNSKKQGDTASQKIEGDSSEETSAENNTKATGDASAANKASVAMKKTVAKEEVEAMFEGEDLSESFKEKATTFFQAAMSLRLQEEKAALEEEFEQKLEEQVAHIVEDLSTKVDDYLNYVVEQWMEENEIAVESSLRSEITEQFIEGFRQLCVENNVELPEEKIDVVGELAAQIEELEGKLDEAVNANIEMQKTLEEQTKELVFAEVAEGLAATQIDKFTTLAEGIDFDDADTYKRKLELVKENYFAEKKATATTIAESEEAAAEGLNESVQQPVLSGPVANYVQAISRTVKK